jgi:uncharacterized protein YjiS (DUF1127 family)
MSTMAAIDQISAQKASIFCSPAVLLEAAWTKFSNYRMYRKTVNELSALSSRELADLGLNRSMLKRVAYQAAYENQ